MRVRAVLILNDLSDKATCQTDFISESLLNYLNVFSKKDAEKIVKVRFNFYIKPGLTSNFSFIIDPPLQAPRNSLISGDFPIPCERI